MLDEKSIRLINEHFPLSVLLGDWQTTLKVAADVIRLKPDSEELINQYLKTKSPVERQNAALFIILKDEELAPYIAVGFGTTWESFGSGGSRWWCTPYQEEFDRKTNTEQPRKLTERPKFLTAAQSRLAQAELKSLKTFGDAPKYLGTKVLEWARRSPLDRRVPESLYITYEANGWDKYGCGNDQELRVKIGNLLRKRYPDNEWTLKLTENEN